MTIRHLLTIIVLAVALLVSAIACVAQEPDDVWKFLKVDQPLVIAHRGASSVAPENTLAAIHAALELGVDVIEIDVHKTRDSELVVIHDNTVDRTTDGTGWVHDFTLDQLRELNAGSWFRPLFRRERIPTLREVLEIVKDQAILLIELKGAATEVPTVELVREFGMSEQVIIQSFDAKQIQKAKHAAPDIPTILLVKVPEHSSEPERAALWMANKAEQIGASGVGIRYNWHTPELMAIAAQRGLAIFVWTVDKKVDMRTFIHAGVHGIITNRPQDLQSLLQ